MACLNSKLNKIIKISGNNFNIILKENDYQYNKKPLLHCINEANELFEK